jgi:hypothetical protein
VGRELDRDKGSSTRFFTTGFQNRSDVKNIPALTIPNLALAELEI